MTPTKQVATALQALADNCDGAVLVDGRGFNKHDAHMGNLFAKRSTERELTVGQLFAALHMLRKYRRQLEAAGLTLPEPPELLADVRQHAKGA